MVEMRDPKVMSDDVHTGQAGVPLEKILWSEAVTFTTADIKIIDENGDPVPFTVSGSNTRIMEIQFADLLYNRYNIQILDSVVSTATGRPIDGDNGGFAGGDVLIIMEHRKRADLNNDNQINFLDLVKFAEEWLWQI